MSFNPKRFIYFFLLFILGPAAPLLALSLADAHWQYFSGESAKALSSYKSIFEATGSTDAALNAATVAQELGHQKDAIAILKRANKVHPDNETIQSELAWASLNNEDKLSDAIPLFENLNKSSATPSIRNKLGLAWTYYETKHFAEAKRLLKEAAAQDPFMTLVTYLEGRVAQGENKAEEAIPFFEQTIKNDSHFVEVRSFLGDLYEHLNKPDDAWRQFARLSYAGTGSVKAERGMERLASRITKKPAEILPPTIIPKHTAIPIFPDRDKYRTIKIGIGTGPAGESTTKRTVSFRASHPFTVTDPASGDVLLQGTAKDPWAVQVSANKKFATIVDSTGNVRGTFKKSILITPNADNATVIINSLTYVPGRAWSGMSDKELRGAIQIDFSTKRKTLIIINRVSIEEYVYGVLAAEMPYQWPLEALKCQAVIARTLAVYRQNTIRLHRKFGYDLCDEEHCQVYGGVGVENDKVRAAVDATRNRILAYDGRPAHSVFHSNCSGVSQSGSQVGWGDVPYWKKVSDAKEGTELPRSPFEFKTWIEGNPAVHCAASAYTPRPEFRWTRVVWAEDLALKLPRRRRVGRIRQILIQKRNSSGRVQKIKIVGTKGEQIITREHLIRKYMGLGSLRSTQFVLEPVVRGGKTFCFIIYGGGWGHGVGLCQSGAAGRAEAGQNYKEILAAYFPGTTLE